MQPSSPTLFDRVEPGARKAHKRSILSSALACFDECGLEATTIEMIRERAGSSVGSIYHHFTSKDGLVAALCFAALDDQLALAQPRIQAVASARDAVAVMVQTYLEWVTLQPQMARFLFQAHSLVAAGPFKQELVERNRQRYSKLYDWLAQGVKDDEILALPKEIYASLLIGQSENYCRLWLEGRAKGKPIGHVDIFIEAAWRSIQRL